MCASPLSPRHAQPDWMGGGLVSRQMMHAPPSAAISIPGESAWRSGRVLGVGTAQAAKEKSQFWGYNLGIITYLSGPEGPEPALGSLGATCSVVMKEIHYHADVALASRPRRFAR